MLWLKALDIRESVSRSTLIPVRSMSANTATMGRSRVS